MSPVAGQCCLLGIHRQYRGNVDDNVILTVNLMSLITCHMVFLEGGEGGGGNKIIVNTEYSAIITTFPRLFDCFPDISTLIYIYPKIYRN